jgi:hypothetical protein
MLGTAAQVPKALHPNDHDAAPQPCGGLLTHGLYSEFAGMINGRSVASGWGDGKEGRHCDHHDADDCSSHSDRHHRQQLMIARSGNNLLSPPLFDSACLSYDRGLGGQHP